MSEEPTLRSRRPLTLRFDIPISKTRGFWDALKGGRLATTKCSSCGHVSFPPQADCPECLSAESTWTDLGNEAQLLTFTNVQVTPASFVDEGPYMIAIGKLKDGPKLLAWLEGFTNETAKPGALLRVEVRASEGGLPYCVFVRP